MFVARMTQPRLAAPRRCPSFASALLGVVLMIGCTAGDNGGGGGGPPARDAGSGTDAQIAAQCSPTCATSELCCGGVCSNRMVPAGTAGKTDPSFVHCGACNNGCDEARATACSVSTSMGGSPQCMCGDFAQCLPGEACVLDGSLHRCANLSTDPENCGELGRMCNAGETCSGGDCVCGSGPCMDGETCCAGTCVNTTNDPDNCGGCGESCGVDADSCVDSGCRCGSSPPCEPGGLLGTVPQQCCGGGCAAPDVTNCGGCGVTCNAAGGESCAPGLPPPLGTGEYCCSTLPVCVGGLLPDGGLGLPDAGFSLPDAGVLDAGTLDAGI